MATNLHPQGRHIRDRVSQLLVQYRTVITAVIEGSALLIRLPLVAHVLTTATTEFVFASLRRKGRN